MIRFEYDPSRPRELILHVDDEGCDNLAGAAQDARPGNKVFLGDMHDGTGLLIVRHVDFTGAEEAPDA